MYLNEETGLPFQISLYAIDALNGDKNKPLGNSTMLLAAHPVDALEWIKEFLPHEQTVRIIEYANPFYGLAEQSGIDLELINKAKQARMAYQDGSCSEWNEEQKKYSDRALETWGKIENKLKPLVNHLHRTRAATCFISGRSRPERAFEEVPELPENVGLFSVEVQRVTRWPWLRKTISYFVIAENFEDAKDWALTEFKKRSNNGAYFMVFAQEVDAGSLIAEEKMPDLSHSSLSRLKNDLNPLANDYTEEIISSIAREATLLLKQTEKTPKAIKLLSNHPLLEKGYSV